MEIRNSWRSFVLLMVCAVLACAQGLTTNATKHDWEEVNFEFNSSVLSDGYPSLLRLAELLQAHPDYRVKLDGNTDSVGSNRYNDKLASARAATVKNFLVKYGAAENQISTVAHGKKQPKVSNTTKEGRFINRRVGMTVTDGQGKVVSAGGIGDAIKAMQAPEDARKKCCEDILKRLDKLDEILAAIKDLKAENDKLKEDVAALKQGQAGVEKQVAELPRPPEKAELQRMMDTTADTAIQKAKPSRFSLLGINLGPSLGDVAAPWEGKTHGSGSFTFTGKGRYFAPFGKDETSAVQAEGEYMYYRDRQEGQFDLGLVNRWTRMQAGLFSSIKHVNVSGLGGGTLGQAAFTADYLFSRGRLGFFGTKGYLTDRVIARTPTMIAPTADNGLGTPLLNYNLLTEYYLRVVDQAGFSAQVGLWNDAYVEGNFGALFRSGGNNRPGGTIRLVQPFSQRFAFTTEASMNETLVGSKNIGRVAFGVQFGNWVKPKDTLEVKHPVPVDIPRVRYEILTRQVRVGHTPPVADAGPDQIGVPAGTINLDASASYSPEGLPLKFAWQQISGPAVQLANADTSKASFTAAESASYQFRVTVTDSLGSQAIARTTVTTAAAPAAHIVSFTANPNAVQPGGTSVLSWQVENADTVEITGLGQVNPKAGSATVAPTQTTTYTLTARNSKGEVTAAQTVTVMQAPVRILSFTASPASIGAGQSSTLQWQTQNADNVTITNVGAVAVNGSVSVSPTQTTTYILTASNAGGQATAQATVTVSQGVAIGSFAANPSTINAGQSSTLSWTTTGATSASISGIGTVPVNGSTQVSPAQTTTYTLTVTGAGGATVTRDVTVTVNTAAGAPVAVIAGGPDIYTKLSQYTLDASGSTNPGGGTLTFQWSAPPEVYIVNANTARPTILPPLLGTYVMSVTVTNSRGESSTASVRVTFLPPDSPKLP